MVLLENMFQIKNKKIISNLTIRFETNKIDKLRNKFQVFITTHEPLLVVNADSNNIIIAENDKIAVNHNNQITYENLSFIGNVTSKERMIETIAALVDGSYDDVKERNKIYGGMLNDRKDES